MIPNAVEIVPDIENPDVEVEVINAGVLTALAVVTRQPRGNPGAVEPRHKKAADMAVTSLAAVIPVAYYSRRDTGGHNRACGGCRLL